MTHPLAMEDNEILTKGNPNMLNMLSDTGKALYFPKGILTQTAEATQKAGKFNVTIGIAKEKGEAMYLPSVMRYFKDLSPDEVLPYASSPGNMPVRRKWKDMMVKKNPSLASTPFSMPSVVSGITHGLCVAGDLFGDEGDTLLLPEKYWGNYNMIFSLRRGIKIARYPFFNSHGGLDMPGFEKAMRQHAALNKKLIVLLNFPNNPTGYSATHAEARAIANVLKEIAANGCSVVVICDDAYFGLFYDANVFPESLFTLLANAHENLMAVKVDGASKEDYGWGLRIGFISFGIRGGTDAMYSALERKAGGCIRSMVSNCSQPAQTILLKAMNDPKYDEERREKGEILRRRAARVKDVLANPRYASAWTPYPFNSGYFMCLKMAKLNAETYRVHLLDEYGIGVIAEGDHDIRVAFSCIEEENIQELFDLMFDCADIMLKK